MDESLNESPWERSRRQRESSDFYNPQVHIHFTSIKFLYRIELLDGALKTGDWYSWGFERAKRKASYVLWKYVRNTQNRSTPVLKYVSHINQGEN